MWITQTEADLNAIGDSELAKILPEAERELLRRPGTAGERAGTASGRTGRDTTPRISRTTDDLPQPAPRTGKLLLLLF